VMYLIDLRYNCHIMSGSGNTQARNIPDYIGQLYTVRLARHLFAVSPGLGQ